MSHTLVAVHGRDFKPPGDVLSELWYEALRIGIERDAPERLEAFANAHKIFVHYGDLTAALLRDAEKPYDEALDVADRRNLLAELSKVGKRKKFDRTRYDHLPGKSPLKELVADLAAPLLGSLGLAEKALERAAPEYPAYWSEGAYRDGVRQRVRDGLAGALARGDRVLVLSHCLGSVATWDALWTLSREADAAEPRRVDEWITIGSPLGNETVKRKLAGADRSGLERYPSNVVNWTNVAAEDDWISHDKTVANDYAGMLEGRLVSRIRDHRIYNLALRFGRSNPHSALGYLVHPRIAALVAEWLSS